MQIRMQNAETLTEAQIQEFLKGSQEIPFEGQNRAERYRWVQRVLVGQEYAVQGKKRRGDVRAFVSKVTGLSLPQVTRLIRQYRAGGVVEETAYRRRRFARKYSNQDIALVAELDRAHNWLSGPATVHILKREQEQFGKSEYARLAGISVAHLYDLRRSVSYRKLAAKWEPTRAQHDRDWGTAPARSAGTARLSPHRHSSSVRLERSQRGVPHQCRGCGDAVANGGLRGPDQRAALYGRCWKPCCTSFPSGFWASTPTTARSTSTTKWPSCSRVC